MAVEPVLRRIKYYNNVLFHKVERNFVVQTGDPTGTGKGGSSINGCVHAPSAGQGRHSVVMLLSLYHHCMDPPSMGPMRSSRACRQTCSTKALFCSALIITATYYCLHRPYAFSSQPGGCLCSA